MTLEVGQDDRIERLDVAEAASRLGISIEALRKRIQRGTLSSESQDGHRYVVLTPQDLRPDDDGPGLDNGRTTQNKTEMVDRTRQDVFAGDDQANFETEPSAVAELVQLLREERGRVDREREIRSQAEQAAAMWQERARNLETENGRLQELLALPAHDEEPEARQHWWQWWQR